MEFKPFKNPEIGDYRSIYKFLLFPKCLRINNSGNLLQTKWLGKYKIKQLRTKCPGCSFDSYWNDVSWDE